MNRNRDRDKRVRKPTCYLTRGYPITGGRTVLLILGCVFLSSAGPIQKARGEIDAPSVQRAIDRGVAYLRKSQEDRGGWNEYGSQSCGLSALCTLSLINAGVSRDDKDLSRAMRYFRSFEPHETYSVSLQTLVYCQLGAAGDLPRIRRNVQWLMDNQINESGSRRRVGGWSYGNNRGSGDPSNSQFALLALGAAKDRGIEIDNQVFERSLLYWQSHQRRDGGWGYGSSQPTTGSMTCAGIASLIIARNGLSASDLVIDGETIRCCGQEDEGSISAGLAWLGKAFSTEVNPGGDSMTYFYYLYALERVGRLSGRRFIGGHDWYREGAEKLLKLQDEFQGFWAGAAPMESNRDIATSFALLFLSKGKRQVVVGQLQYPTKNNTDWRSHPEGLQKLVKQVERDWRRDLTWQTIVGEADRGNVASVEDLLQTPVLIIEGRERLEISQKLNKNLAEYIEQGGSILFEASAGDGCGDAKGFETSVRELCSQWFDGASLDRLAPDHPVWYAEHPVAPKSLELIDKNFWVYGVQACCRTAVFYVPNSLSCRWELRDVLLHNDTTAEKVKKQVDLAIRIGENVIAYATGRELKDKLENRTVLDSREVPKSTRGTLEIAEVTLGAGGEEARRAIPNASALIRNRIPIDIAAADSPVSLSADNLGFVPILWMHGRTEFELNDEQRESLRTYIQNGGIVLGTSICGSKSFSDSFRKEIGFALGDVSLEIMPGSHSAFTTTYGGFDIRSVEIRSPSENAMGRTVNRRKGPPNIEFASISDHANVFFSPLDISCALESQNSVQCPGYPTEDAAKIVANLILYSLNQ